MAEFAAIRPKTYSYLTDGNDENKISRQKKCVIKRKIKFEDYESYLEANHFENEIKNLQKNLRDMNSLKKNQKEFIKNIRLILKSQQKFRSVKHNIFTEEVNKIASSPNDDKRIQSIESTKTYAYGTRKDLICKNEEIKCDNITKQYKKRLT